MVITRVDDNGPAQKAGIKVGDVIVRFDGNDVGLMPSFGDLLAKLPPGYQAMVALNRQGKEFDTVVRIGSRP
jgi:serine protease Do